MDHLSHSPHVQGGQIPAAHGPPSARQCQDSAAPGMAGQTTSNARASRLNRRPVPAPSAPPTASNALQEEKYKFYFAQLSQIVKDYEAVMGQVRITGPMSQDCRARKARTTRGASDCRHGPAAPKHAQRRFFVAI